jgi:Acyl-CoA carboxylase epsilon subunit
VAASETPAPHRNGAPSPTPAGQAAATGSRSPVPSGGPPDGAGARAAPALSVVRGSPTAEELAALVTALVAVQSARAAAALAAAAPMPHRYGWSSKSRLAGAPLLPGPGAWRASAFPW